MDTSKIEGRIKALQSEYQTLAQQHAMIGARMHGIEGALEELQGLLTPETTTDEKEPQP